MSVTTVANKFAWSYSALRNFETCPKRYYHYSVAKDVREPESENLRAGHALHQAFEARVKTLTPLPLGMRQHETLLAKLAAAPGEVHAEQKLALTSTFRPSAFFGRSVWFRTVVDYTNIRPDGTASVLDYKSGKPSEDTTQLALMAATIMHHDAKVSRVKAGLVFVAYDQVERAEYVREDITEIWSEILPRVRKLADARNANEYPAKPGGLCRRYCAVTSCSYHGR